MLRRVLSSGARLPVRLPTAPVLAPRNALAALAAAEPKARARSDRAFYALGGLAGAAAGVLATAGTVAFASDDALEPPHYPWAHHGPMSGFDTAALRRGYEVYRQVCSQCHSMNLIAFRNLVGVTHTEEQAKALAASFKVKDGPDEKGEYFERPGKLADHFPAPYPNEEFARYINNGALPPDLSLMVKARHHGADYVFALLTGYRDPPAGIKMREGLHYNPYFPGGAIAMAKALNDGGMDFEDGTPATESQMAKDVTSFLCWAAEPEHDTRKKMGVQFMTAVAFMIAITAYHKRLKWNVIKTRRITYKL